MPDSTASRIYPIAVFSLAVLGVGSLTVKVLAPFGPAIAWAVVLAVGFAGPWRVLERRMPRHRSLAAVLLTLAVGLLVVLPAGFLAGVLVNEAIGVFGRTSASLAARNVSGLEDLLQIPAVREAFAWMEAKSGVTTAELLARAGEVAAGISGLLARLSGGVVRSLFDAVVTFLVTLFVLFFLLRDRWVLWKPALKWGLLIAGLQGAISLNEWPLRWMDYDTAVSTSTFALQQIALAELTALLQQVDPTSDSTAGTGALDWGRLPDRMPVAFQFPSVMDPSLAPAGQHVASAYGFCFPCKAPRSEPAPSTTASQGSAERDGTKLWWISSEMP